MNQPSSWCTYDVSGDSGRRVGKGRETRGPYLGALSNGVAEIRRVVVQSLFAENPTDVWMMATAVSDEDVIVAWPFSTVAPTRPVESTMKPW